MDLLANFLEILLHIDRHLIEVSQQHPIAVYLMLFLIVFCETGLVVLPFLPGDSLLFAVGALSAVDALHAGEAFLVLTTAAIVGDGVNYWIGRRLAARVLSGRLRFVNPDHLDYTYRFYERHGRKTVVLARFVPIVRTFAPFVAGVGRMDYRRFTVSNVLGGTLWVGVCIGAGFVWGNQPWVKENFGLVILGIVLVSILPALVQLLLHRRESGSSVPSGSRPPIEFRRPEPLVDGTADKKKRRGKREIR